MSATVQESQHIVVGHILIAIGVAIVGVISYWVLKAATRLSRVLGVAGMNAMARIMGFLLICIGVQFIINGVLDVAKVARASYAFSQTPRTADGSAPRAVRSDRAARPFDSRSRRCAASMSVSMRHHASGENSRSCSKKSSVHISELPGAGALNIDKAGVGMQSTSATM